MGCDDDHDDEDEEEDDDDDEGAWWERPVSVMELDQDPFCY